MKSKLFDYVKEKALDDNTKNINVYIQDKNEPAIINAFYQKNIRSLSPSELAKYFLTPLFNTQITHSEFYKLVLKKIDEYQKKDLKPAPYLMVHNTYESIAELVAQLELGYSPILINGHEYMNKTSREMHLADQDEIVKEKRIDDYYEHIPYIYDKLQKTMNDIQKSLIINDHKEGSIGILSSGSTGNPKIVFVPEEKIINNILSSKYANEKRSLYNTSSVSNVSGLVTNVFMPFVLDRAICHLSDSFSFDEALNCTDIYLPRNFIDSLPNNYENVYNRIKRIFILGGVNNLDIVRTVRDKINLGENTFVNVYGCTECGGLISEFEEKDFDELTINHFDVKDDYVIYGYRYPDGRVEGGSLYKDSKSLLHNIGDIKGLVRRDIKVIPCGRLSENKIKIDGINIGECIVDGYHTGDIGVVFNDKIYILGRKEALEKQQIAGVRDASISASAGYTCSTITNEYGNLCIVVKYNINDDKEDKTLYFRNLITKSKDIKDKIIKAHNLYDVVFLTDDKFIESPGLKKPITSSIEIYLDYCRKLNIILNDFDSYLSEHVNTVCEEKLGYIPKWTYTKEFILFDKNDINLEQIVDLFNDLHIVLVEEKDDHYYIYYDDRYFFDPKLSRKYSNEDLLKYKECIKNGTLFEQLVMDNDRYVSNLSYNVTNKIPRLSKSKVYFIEGILDNGDTILLPYGSIPIFDKIGIDEQLLSNPAQLAIKKIKEQYKNVDIKTQTLTCPCPLELSIKGNLGYLGFLGKYIVITKDGNIRYENSNIHPAFDASKFEEEINYLLSLIARNYNLNYNNGNNKLKIKKEKEVN